MGHPVAQPPAGDILNLTQDDSDARMPHSVRWSFNGTVINFLSNRLAVDGLSAHTN
ncbi:MAG: hypothetical protein Q9P01_21055 [Anaerolineae bacterium]|nr:hypothetical protein [Anaerolineae bacterium]